MLRSSRHAPWLPRAGQLALLLAAEASWLAAWSVALGSWLAHGGDSPLLSPPIVGGLLIAAAGLTRLATAGSRVSRLIQALLALLGLGWT